jgi:hypothetical protein
LPVHSLPPVVGCVIRPSSSQSANYGLVPEVVVQRATLAAGGPDRHRGEVEVEIRDARGQAPNSPFIAAFTRGPDGKREH